VNGDYNATGTPTLVVSLPAEAVRGDLIEIYNGADLLTTVTLTRADINGGSVNVHLPTQANGTFSFVATLANHTGSPIASSTAYSPTITETPPSRRSNYFQSAATMS